MARRGKLRVSVILDADGSKAKREIKETQNAFASLRSGLTRVVAGYTAAIVAVRGVVGAITSSINAFRVQEDAIRKLDAALAPLGASADAVSKGLQAQAAALQEVTRFGDEAIIQGQALVASFTKDEEAIKGATVAALDLASATGQSLQSAFLLLGRAAAGETSALSRYGIILDESVPKSEKFAAALAKINSQFGGQAVAQAETFTGTIDQLTNAFGDLQEVIGEQIGQNEQVNETLRNLKDLFVEIGPAVGKTTALFVTFGIELTKIVTGPLRLIFKGVTELTDLFLGLSAGVEATAASQGALEATAKRLGLSVEELKRRLELAKNETLDLNEALEDEKQTVEDSTVSHRGLLSAFDDLIGGSEEWQRAIADQTQAVAEDAEALGVEVVQTERLTEAQAAAKLAIDETTEALREQAEQASINDEGGSFILGQGLGGRPLFDFGEGGGSYTYTYRRASPTQNGGVRFV